MSRNVVRRLLGAVLMLVPGGLSAQVLPTNGTLFNARLTPSLVDFYLGGSDLDGASGATNPLFTVARGGSLLFGVSLSNNKAETVQVSFAGVPVQFATTGSNAGIGVPGPNGTTVFTYAALAGGQNFRQQLNFDTLGSYAGTIALDVLTSSPDYSYNGAPANAVEGRTLTYRVQVVEPAAVPEPAGWLAMIGGLAVVGAVMRFRRRAPALL